MTQHNSDNNYHRSHIPQSLRDVFSRLHKIINQRKFIRGSLVFLRNKCGKKNCKCYKGEPHVSLYIRKTTKGKPKMTLIPKTKWEEVKQMSTRYKHILNLLEEVSDYEWEHIKDKDQEKSKGAKTKEKEEMGEEGKEKGIKYKK